MLIARCLFSVSVILPVLCVVANGSSPSDAPPKPDSPAAPLVDNALRAEVSGDRARREHLLGEACRLDASFGPARWHSGCVLVSDDWVPVEEAEKAVASAGVYQQYRLATRDRCGGNLAGQVALASWCRKHQLTDLEHLHWWQVLRHDSKHGVARRRLGVRDYKGQLLTDEQIEARKVLEDERARRRDRWSPKVLAWRHALSSGTESERKAALAELTAVSEPAALFFVEAHLSGLRDEEVDLAVVGLSSKLGGSSATLLQYAVFSDHPAVRAAATDVLKRRSWYSFVPTLIGALQAPVEVTGRADLLANGASFGVIIEQDTPLGMRSDMYAHRSFKGHVHSFVRDGQIVQNSETPLPDVGTAVRGQSKIGRLHSSATESNVRIALVNERIYPILELATNQQLDRRPQAWWEWWQQHNEIEGPPQGTVFENSRTTAAFNQTKSVAMLPSTRQRPQDQDSQNGRRIRLRKVTFRDPFRPSRNRTYYTTSCFMAGTTVWTNAGPMPIEKARAGDLVLSQNVDTGELAYRPVLGTTYRRPSASLRIGLEGEEIAATRGHPFWVVGKGWRMTKELAAGDRLHGVHGATTIEYVEDGPQTDAFNLVVAGHHNFFVGRHRTLVHDNLIRQPTRAVVPGLVID